MGKFQDILNLLHTISHVFFHGKHQYTGDKLADIEKRKILRQRKLFNMVPEGKFLFIFLTNKGIKEKQCCLASN